MSKFAHRLHLMRHIRIEAVFGKWMSMQPEARQERVVTVPVTPAKTLLDNLGERHYLLP
jgi:hypothetical protein